MEFIIIAHLMDAYLHFYVCMMINGVEVKRWQCS